MPITNGYEACSSILKLYKSSNFFNMNMSGSNVACLDLKPVIVACSSFINDKVIKNTNEIGFDAAYPCPLLVSTIKHEIKTML